MYVKSRDYAYRISFRTDMKKLLVQYERQRHIAHSREGLVTNSPLYSLLNQEYLLLSQWVPLLAPTHLLPLRPEYHLFTPRRVPSIKKKKKNKEKQTRRKRFTRNYLRAETLQNYELQSTPGDSNPLLLEPPANSQSATQPFSVSVA